MEGPTPELGMSICISKDPRRLMLPVWRPELENHWTRSWPGTSPEQASKQPLDLAPPKGFLLVRSTYLCVSTIRDGKRGHDEAHALERPVRSHSSLLTVPSKSHGHIKLQGDGSVQCYRAPKAGMMGRILTQTVTSAWSMAPLP